MTDQIASTNRPSDAHSVPRMDPSKEGLVSRLNSFLDKYVLPYPVKYLTNRLTILGTLSMLLPLIIFADVTVFVLATNSYLNVMSVVVSSTVLLYSTLSEAREREASARREEIAAKHEKMVEDRAEQDHQLIAEIHDHIDEMRAEIMGHVNTKLDRIEQTLLEKLAKLQDEDHTHISETHSAVLAGMQAHREELSDLHALIKAMNIPPPPKN